MYIGSINLARPNESCLIAGVVTTITDTIYLWHHACETYFCLGLLILTYTRPGTTPIQRSSAGSSGYCSSSQFTLLSPGSPFFSSATTTTMSTSMLSGGLGFSGEIDDFDDTSDDYGDKGRPRHGLLQMNF